MKKLSIVLIIFFALPFVNKCAAQDMAQPIQIMVGPVHTTFKSLDGLPVSCQYASYDENDKGLIVLCHQAGWSSGEYKTIIPILNDMGYNCLAINQRSGKKVNDVVNKTAKKAKELNKPTTYLDAEQDIVAAVRFAKKKAKKRKQKIILWGSSYSASLVLKVAQDEGVDKVLSFSPGEYFGNDMTLTEKINKLDIPVFITCSKKEIAKTQLVFDAIPSTDKIFFKPITDGNHGSRALWAKFADNKDYWKAVKAFLK